MPRNPEEGFPVPRTNKEVRDALARRIQVLVERAGGPGALSRKTGIPPSTLATYLSGEAEPKTLRLASLARAGRVGVGWLATGEGPMEEGFQVNEPAAPYAGRQASIEALGDLQEFLLVPRHGAPAVESEVGYVAFRKDWLRLRGVDPENALVIRVTGDAMAPEIPDGALVLVDTAQERMGPDGIYVLMVDGAMSCRRLERDLASGGVIVHHANPSYRDQALTADQAQALYIVGRVVWLAKEL